MLCYIQESQKHLVYLIKGEVMELLFFLTALVLFVMVIIWIRTTAKHVKRISKSMDDIKVLITEIDTVLKVRQFD